MISKPGNVSKEFYEHLVKTGTTKTTLEYTLPRVEQYTQEDLDRAWLWGFAIALICVAFVVLVAYAISHTY